MPREAWIRLVVIVAAVAVLELLCRGGAIRHTAIIPPSEMAQALWRILRAGTFNADILTTFRDIALAAAISIGLGFALGVGIHAWPDLRLGLEPMLASYYAVPTFILYPVFIILFGVGSGAITAVAVMLAIVAMITATLNGLDRIPSAMRRTARVLRMGPLSTALRISLPAALPYLFTGMKLSVAYAVIGVIASEFILSGSGIGYSIAYAYNNFDNQTMYGLMLLVILAVVAINTGLHMVDRRLNARRGR